MPEFTMNIFRIALQMYQNEQSEQSQQSQHLMLEKEKECRVLSPKIRNQVKGSFKKTRNTSIDNFMKYQWSWSL